MLAFDRRQPHPTETVMTRIQRCLGVLAGLGAALCALAAAAPAALATPAPPDPNPPWVVPPATIHTVATGGMPGWQITLIAAAAALDAAVAAVVLDRARTARRRMARPAT
jgi:hypothetical protein